MPTRFLDLTNTFQLRENKSRLILTHSGPKVYYWFNWFWIMLCEYKLNSWQNKRQIKKCKLMHFWFPKIRIIFRNKSARIETCNGRCSTGMYSLSTERWIILNMNYILERLFWLPRKDFKIIPIIDAVFSKKQHIWQNCHMNCAIEKFFMLTDFCQLKWTFCLFLNVKWTDLM